MFSQGRQKTSSKTSRPWMTTAFSIWIHGLRWICPNFIICIGFPLYLYQNKKCIFSTQYKNLLWKQKCRKSPPEPTTGFPLTFSGSSHSAASIMIWYSNAVFMINTLWRFSLHQKRLLFGINHLCHGLFCLFLSEWRNDGQPLWF